MSLRFDVLTVFPGAFDSPLRAGLLGKALDEGALEVALHDLRDWAPGPHRKVDDEPFGGGPGMVMRPEPLVAAAEAVMRPGGRVVVLSASGRRFTQDQAVRMSRENQVVLVCGRYEGVDERVYAALGAEPVSIGDFVLMGGEVAAMAVIEAVARLLPGVIGNPSSLTDESYAGGLLEYPQYTRPAEFRGMEVPPVLVSGDHAAVAAWRRRMSLVRTARLRPDLLEGAGLTDDERNNLQEWLSSESSQDP